MMKIDFKRMVTSIKKVVCSRGFVLGALFALVCFMPMEAFATVTGAFTKVETEILAYVPLVRKVIYAIAGVVAVVGCISVFFKMNNEDQDVKKSIMMIVGACIFLVAAAEALPMFFGISE